MDDNEWPIPKSWEGVTSRQRDFGNNLTKLAAMYSSVIWFRNPKTGHCYGQGTGFILSIAQHKFLVTNAHVLQGYRQLQEEQGAVQFVFGGQEFDPHIIDAHAHPDVDLATIDVSRLTFQQRAPGYCGSTASLLVPFAAPSWPEAPPEQGWATLCVGWPGRSRKVEDDSILQSAASPLLGMPIDDVTEESVTIPFNRPTLISGDFDPINRVVDETDFGGFSGAPVFIMHRAGIRPLGLVGIVRSYRVNFDLLSCTRADLISENGKISSKKPREFL